MGIKVIVDLRAQFGRVRDQGSRPTCMAFAASDAHAFVRCNADPLSVECAFYNAVRRKSIPDRTRGVPFDQVSRAIAIDGQPLESDWPYITNLTAEDDWKPPDHEGTLFYRDSHRIVADLASIYSLLDSGQPAIIGMHISISFFHAKAGTILVAAPDESPRNRHAILGVGYGESKGEGCLLARNSWGEQWGDDGHVWMHEEYLRPRLLCVGVMED